jgi:hypothetical protein
MRSRSFARSSFGLAALGLNLFHFVNFFRLRMAPPCASDRYIIIPLSSPARRCRKRQTRPWAVPAGAAPKTTPKTSAKYMPLYVAKFQFRYNNRENADIFGAANAGC